MSSLPHVSPAVLEFNDNHGIAKRNLLEALLTHADWILTGTSTHPEQLTHALMNYATRKYDRLRLDPAGVEVLASILADIAVGIPPRLQCWKCGAVPEDCDCCPKHRLDEEPAEDCVFCLEVKR
jgi:hypothetical protein